MNTISSLLKNLRNRTPVGTIQMYGGATAPTDWLPCDGRAISRSEYSALFAIIGTTYGAGNGTTTFNIPDMRDRVPVGSGSSYALNAANGSETSRSVTPTGSIGPTRLSDQEIAHGHGFTQPAVSGGAVTNGITGGSHDHELRTYAAAGTAGTGYAYQPSASGKYNKNADWIYNSTHTHNLPSHTHSVSGGAVANLYGASSTRTAHGHSLSLDTKTVDIRQPYRGINFIIYAGK